MVVLHENVTSARNSARCWIWSPIDWRRLDCWSSCRIFIPRCNLCAYRWYSWIFPRIGYKCTRNWPSGREDTKTCERVAFDCCACITPIEYSWDCVACPRRFCICVCSWLRIKSWTRYLVSYRYRKRSSSAFPSSRRSIRSSKKRSASALCERSRRNSSFSLFLDFCWNKSLISRNCGPQSLPCVNTSLNLRRNEKKPGLRRTDEWAFLTIIIASRSRYLCVVIWGRLFLLHFSLFTFLLRF